MKKGEKTKREKEKGKTEGKRIKESKRDRNKAQNSAGGVHFGLSRGGGGIFRGGGNMVFRYWSPLSCYFTHVF